MPFYKRASTLCTSRIQKAIHSNAYNRKLMTIKTVFFTHNKFIFLLIYSLAGSKDVEYRLAQSGDATCTGLENPEFGSRIMTLKRFGPAERCDFPKWFKEPKHWHSLNGELSYNVHQKYVDFHLNINDEYHVNLKSLFLCMHAELFKNNFLHISFFNSFSFPYICTYNDDNLLDPMVRFT